MRNMQIIGLLWVLSVLLSAPFVACAQGIVKKNEGIAKSSKWENIKSSCSERFRSLSPQTKAGLAIAGAIPAYYAARTLNYKAINFLINATNKNPEAQNTLLKLITLLAADSFVVGGAAMAAYVAAMIPFLQPKPQTLPKP